jgi:hypothetical protein
MTPEERLAVLREILTDITNQVEVTRLGYYIYRFDLETMQQIAAALIDSTSETVIEVSPSGPLRFILQSKPE